MPKVKWNDEMDAALSAYINQHNPLADGKVKRWPKILTALHTTHPHLFASITQPKQLNERWVNYLKPGLIQKMSRHDIDLLKELLADRVRLIEEKFISENNNINWSALQDRYFAKYSYSTLKNNGHTFLKSTKLQRAQREGKRRKTRRERKAKSPTPSPEPVETPPVDEPDITWDFLSLPLQDPSPETISSPTSYLPSWELTPSPTTSDNARFSSPEYAIMEEETGNVEELFEYSLAISDRFPPLEPEPPPFSLEVEIDLLQAAELSASQSNEAPLIAHPVYPGLELIDLTNAPIKTHNFMWTEQRDEVLKIVAAAYADSAGLVSNWRFIFDELKAVAPPLFADMTDPRQARLRYNNQLKPSLEKITTRAEKNILHSALDSGQYKSEKGINWRCLIEDNFPNYSYDNIKFHGIKHLKQKTSRAERIKRRGTRPVTSWPGLFSQPAQIPAATQELNLLTQLIS